MNAPEARTIAIAAATITLAVGERYAGLVLKDGAPSHHLVLLPGDVVKNWHDAQEWAKEQGGDLPTRSEQSLLYAHLKDSFESDWYWSADPYAGDAGYAWMQSFNDGHQDYDHASHKDRCRAVRRAPIQ